MKFERLLRWRVRVGDGGDGEGFVEQREVGVGWTEGVGVGAVGWDEVVDDWKEDEGGREKGETRRR